MSDKSKLFIEELKKLNPSFDVKFKDESLLMKILGKILFFNKRFMTSFTTTLGSTVYFPSRKYLEDRGDDVVITLAHEYVHVQDAKQNLLFPILYLFPVTLAPLMLLVAIFYSWSLGLLLFLLCFAPLPAPWRKKYELRGYTMSLFMFDLLKQKQGLSVEKRRHYLYELIGHFNEQFTDSNYYFMWPLGVKKELQEQADRIVSGSILKEKIYRQMRVVSDKSRII